MKPSMMIPIEDFETAPKGFSKDIQFKTDYRYEDGEQIIIRRHEDSCKGVLALVRILFVSNGEEYKAFFVREGFVFCPFDKLNHPAIGPLNKVKTLWMIPDGDPFYEHSQRAFDALCR